ncbi:MAG: hypothetical protein R3D83_04025 [Caenibius sp.]
MADWLDEQMGGLCKSLQEQIEDNRFLNPLQKQKFLEMLDDCASKARESNEDTLVMMRSELKGFAQQFQAASGKPLKYV